MPEISPNEGQTVITADGHELGTVNEVTGQSFKIDVRFAPDYWLPVSCIEVEQGALLRLALTKIEADASRLNAPPV